MTTKWGEGAKAEPLRKKKLLCFRSQGLSGRTSSGGPFLWLPLVTNKNKLQPHILCMSKDVQIRLCHTVPLLTPIYDQTLLFS